MADISYAIVAGRLTRDPEEKTTAGGTMALFSLASNYPAGKGEKKVSYFDCAATGKMGESILRLPQFKKGLKVLVQGNLRQRRWKNKEDKWQSAFTLYLDSMPNFLEYKPREDGEPMLPPEFNDPDLIDMGEVTFGDDGTIPF
jgi:single-strand DNA-binding protein